MNLTPEQQLRKAELIGTYGCLPEEANEWCRVDYKSAPYFFQMLEAIRKDYEAYRREARISGKGSYNAWKAGVRANYAAYGYTKDKYNNFGRVIGKMPDVWARLRAFEDAFRSNEPQWESPYLKKAYRGDLAQRNLDELEKVVLSKKPERKYTNRRPDM